MDGIDETSFITTILPKDKIAYLKMLEHVHANLLIILKDELKHGNKIVTISGTNEEMIVVLSQPFKKKYELAGLQFESSNNPHTGGDYYSTPQPPFNTLTAPVKK